MVTGSSGSAGSVAARAEVFGAPGGGGFVGAFAGHRVAGCAVRPFGTGRGAVGGGGSVRTFPENLEDAIVHDV